jgi:hypothetical protein
MTYKLDGSKILFTLQRSDILDISPSDVISIEGFPDVSYVWTDHDSDFVENNPDADLFLQLERMDSDRYKATGLVLK